MEEFEQVFSDVLSRDSEFYKKILEMPCAGAKEMPAIKRLLTGEHGGVSEYLRELELAGFVARDYTWNLTSGTDARQPKLDAC